MFLSVNPFIEVFVLWKIIASTCNYSSTGDVVLQIHCHYFLVVVLFALGTNVMEELSNLGDVANSEPNNYETWSY